MNKVFIKEYYGFEVYAILENKRIKHYIVNGLTFEYIIQAETYIQNERCL
jgi:hypothetical protein